MKKTIIYPIKYIAGKARKYPMVSRVLTQALMFITTFQLHNHSLFWELVCIFCLVITSVQNLSEHKLRKASMPKTTEVSEIIKDAVSEILEENMENFTGDPAEQSLQQEGETP